MKNVIIAVSLLYMLTACKTKITPEDIHPLVNKVDSTTIKNIYNSKSYELFAYRKTRFFRITPIFPRKNTDSVLLFPGEKGGIARKTLLPLPP